MKNIEGAEEVSRKDEIMERISRAGFDALNDSEVLEYLLSFPMPRTNTQPYAKRLLTVFKNLKSIMEADAYQLEIMGGLTAKAAQYLKGTATLWRRTRNEEFKRGRVIGSPSEVASYLREDMGAYSKECFSVLYLDQRNHLLSCKRVQEGTVDQTVVYPREIMRRALELNATGMILAHNHPGGSLSPSDADRQLTHQILTAARSMGFTVHDHLIVTAEGSFSFRQAGMLG